MPMLAVCRSIWSILTDTVTGFVDHKGMRLSAAVAFYALLSLAPLVMLAVAMAATVLGPEAARGGLVEEFREHTGQAGAEVIQATIANASKRGEGTLATIIGLTMLVLGASAVFGELQDSLNTIWGVPPRPGNSLLIYLRGRLFSAGLVVAVCFVLLGTVVLSTWLNAVEKAIAGTGYALPAIWQWINGGISFIIILMLYAAVYRYLPDIDVKWKSVLPGAIVAAILFFIGKELIGFYLGKAGVATPFGAAGSVVALVVWIYYSGVLFFIGAELTRAVQTHRTATRNSTGNSTGTGGRPVGQSR